MLYHRLVHLLVKKSVTNASRGSNFVLNCLSSENRCDIYCLQCKNKSDFKVILLVLNLSYRFSYSFSTPVLSNFFGFMALLKTFISTSVGNYCIMLLEIVCNPVKTNQQ